jgi:hypothetical protein
VIERIEAWRREHKWSAQKITNELAGLGHVINRRTVTRHLTGLGLGQRHFLDPNGDNNRMPGKIIARWPGHMAHLDVKKVGRIPDGGGWRVHGRDSEQKRAVERAKNTGGKCGYVYLHSIVDGFSRLAYTGPLGNEKGTTAGGGVPRTSERESQVRELRDREPAPAAVVLAVHDPGLVRMQLQTDLGRPGPQRGQDPFRFRQGAAVHHRIVGVTLERAARVLPDHPRIERIVQKQVRQEHTGGAIVKSCGSVATHTVSWFRWMSPSMEPRRACRAGSATGVVVSNSTWAAGCSGV